MGAPTWLALPASALGLASRVLAENGVEVVLPKAQKCCGALAAHAGVVPQARELARHNLRAFPTDVDAILTNAAGCGSGMITE